MFAPGQSPPPLDLADYGGKRTDVVDFGGGIDYGDHKWFQDKPNRPPPPPAQPEYTPAPEVISMNDSFEYALSSAPNVLYARYKQYGQLGVLAWCSEFSELIDGLKELGFQGNMFTTTRAQALETCSQLLKLPMEIDMQLIVMYLSGQVSRLRHFLDSETVWDDYPIPKFPVHPPQVSISLPV
ncbi:hypothetical protein C0995_004257 [Termitomyces sp. Mi166|nr:hypothetical protein C0995_004257 [Termitomyces sp. Mi166\